ncbi:MAG TPA: sulfatase/phosphatase domain-containing protein, partial [Opitutaceae bacterium]
LADNTFVFFLTDHGISHARGKQFLYDEGIRIPFVVRGPGLDAGAVRDDLVEHIDLAATSLALAGVPVPEWMQARALFAPDHRMREAVFAARDRCDETVERIRSVRTQRFKYIRNYFPERPHLQPSNYKDRKAIVRAIRDWHAAGKLDQVQELVTAATRAPEELYDLENDRWEIRNLAGDPTFRETLLDMRGQLDAWIVETGDKGQEPEPEAAYDAEMEVYLAEKPTGEHRAQIEANIRLMKEWAAAGK